MVVDIATLGQRDYFKGSRTTRADLCNELPQIFGRACQFAKLLADEQVAKLVFQEVRLRIGMHSWLGHPIKCIIIDILATVKVELLQEKWIGVLTNNLHGFSVDVLAVA